MPYVVFERRKEGERIRHFADENLFDSVGGLGECDFDFVFGLEFEFERR